METDILIGKASTGEAVVLNPSMANRHGLIAGATGTGKTVSLQVLAEAFSQIGVPVFTADVKGDLAGLSKEGESSSRIAERMKRLELDAFSPRRFPVLFWDVFGKNGHPIRTSISEMGPLLLGELLELSEAQQGVLEVAFSFADDEGLLLSDMKDLRALLAWMEEHADELQKEYGSVSSRSVGAMQRKLLALNESGGEQFFGEPGSQD